MSPLIYQEGRFLLASVCLGAVIALVYDFLRIFRRVINHGIFWISIEDLGYWIFVSFAIFCLLYYENNGAFRWFAIFGACTGMGLYKVMLGRWLVEYLSCFFLWIKRGCMRCIFRLLKPWRRVGSFLGKKTVGGSRRMKTAARLLKKRLTVQCRLFKMEIHTLYRKADHRQKHGQKKNRHQKEKTE